MAKAIEAVIKDLTDANAQANVIEVARASLAKNFPPKVYTHAVWFLGLATLALVVGAVAALLMGQQSSEAMWTAVGAGLGALAGIFTAKSSA